MRITLFYVCVYDGNVISIIVMMCTHPMYSCADNAMQCTQLSWSNRHISLHPYSP